MEMRWHRFNHCSQMFCFSPLLKTSSILDCSGMKSEFQLFCQEVLRNLGVTEQMLRSAALSKTNLGSNWSFQHYWDLPVLANVTSNTARTQRSAQGLHRASHPEHSWTKPSPRLMASCFCTDSSCFLRFSSLASCCRERRQKRCWTPSSINLRVINIFKKLVLRLKCFLLPISQIYPPNSDLLLRPNAQPLMCQASTADAEQIIQIKVCPAGQGRAAEHSLGF